jgi:hypothetical protein
MSDETGLLVVDPAALGLAGFGLITFVLSVHNVGWAPGVVWIGLVDCEHEPGHCNNQATVFPRRRPAVGPASAPRRRRSVRGLGLPQSRRRGG